MSTIVTGATGFIGSHIVRKLVERGENVKVLIRKTSNTKNIDDLNIEKVYGDVLNKESLVTAFTGCNTLFHSAGLVSFKRSDYKRMVDVNVTGAENVLSAAMESGVKKILFTSSVAAIGPETENSLISENTKFSIYDKEIGYINDKYDAEQVARDYIEKGLPVTILNPSVVLGPGDVNLSSTASVLWYCKKKFPGYMDGTLNIVDVEDVAEGHILAAEKGKTGERYILANANLTVFEYFKLLEKVSGIKAPGLKIPYLMAYATAFLVERVIGKSFPNYTTMDLDSVILSKFNWYADNGKAVKELGFTPTPVENTLEKTITWFKENGLLS